MEEGNEYSEDDFNNEILQESSAQQENKYCELFRNMLIKLKPQTSNLKPPLLLPDLREVELDWGIAIEDENKDSELTLVDVHSIDRPFVVFEWSIDDDDEIAHLEVTLELRCLFAHASLHDTEFLGSDRNWNIPGTDETGDIRGISDHVPTLIRHHHVHEHVTREELTLLLDRLILFKDDLLLFGNDDSEDVVLHTESLDALLDGLLHTVLVSRVRVHDIPISTGAGILLTHKKRESELQSDRRADDLHESCVDETEECGCNDNEDDDDRRETDRLVLRRPADLAKLLKTLSDVGDKDIHGLQKKSGTTR